MNGGPARDPCGVLCTVRSAFVTIGYMCKGIVPVKHVVPRCGGAVGPKGEVARPLVKV